MSIKLPKKGLRFAHLNICSLKNKVHELSPILHKNGIHIMAVSETRLEEATEDAAVSIFLDWIETGMGEVLLFTFKIISRLK